MHKDTQEELKRLEDALLADENDPTRDMDAFLEGLLDEPSDSLAQTQSVPYRNFANGYGKDVPEEFDEDDEDEPAPTPESRKLDRLKFTAAGLLAAIAAVLIYWVVRFL
jgi:hypothetical protein